jgi:CheY-like chemotaxis protein
LADDDLTAAVQWVAERMRRHGLSVRVEDDGHPKPLAEEVLTTAFQSVRELLFNVVKHARATEAVVRIGRAGGEARVTVEDAGPGFDAAGREFTPTADGGFGLFNIRERLDLLGGRLEIDAAPGRGTRATIVAPLRAATAPGPGTPGGVAAPAAAPAGDEDKDGDGDGHARPAAGGLDGRIRVLLADDHHIVREGLRSIIDAQPDMHVVAEAPDGERALELVRAAPPDVVVMDVNMPRMTGLEATRQIAAEAPHVRVIGLSVHEEEDMAAAMRKAGAAAHLGKGGPAENLCAVIRELAGRRG